MIVTSCMPPLLHVLIACGGGEGKPQKPAVDPCRAGEFTSVQLDWPEELVVPGTGGPAAFLQAKKEPIKN